MCLVSAVGDNFKEQLPKSYPDWQNLLGSPNRSEFDALKREVQELKKVLEAAKKFDEVTGQKDCEMDDKVALIKKVAEMVGVDLGNVFNGK